jgi:hypothetical protein
MCISYEQITREIPLLTSTSRRASSSIYLYLGLWSRFRNFASEIPKSENKNLTTTSPTVSVRSRHRTLERFPPTKHRLQHQTIISPLAEKSKHNDFCRPKRLEVGKPCSCIMPSPCHEVRKFLTWQPTLLEADDETNLIKPNTDNALLAGYEHIMHT